MSYTLSMHGTGQITLPKEWRSQFQTKKFTAQKTKEGLLIKPLEADDTPEGLRDENVEVFADGSGIRFKKGLGKEGMQFLIKELRKNV